MPAPFYNLIKSATTTSAGTGAFTPNKSSPGFVMWSYVPVGWIGLVRYDDGNDFELRYGCWNGTTITRPSNIVASTTGSALNLGLSATATLVIDANEIQPHFGSGTTRMIVPHCGEGSITQFGSGTATTLGSYAGTGISRGGVYAYLNPTVMFQTASTANAQGGYYCNFGQVACSSTPGRGGWEFTQRFGSVSATVASRVFVGMASATIAGFTSEPSTHLAAFACVTKDSTDTNLQFCTNDGVTGGTKIDTGIPYVLGSFYEVSIWQIPGSLTTHMLLIRLETGDIYHGSTSVNTPSGSLQTNAILGMTNELTFTQVVLGNTTIRNGA